MELFHRGARFAIETGVAASSPRTGGSISFPPPFLQGALVRDPANSNERQGALHFSALPVYETWAYRRFAALCNFPAAERKEKTGAILPGEYHPVGVLLVLPGSRAASPHGARQRDPPPARRRLSPRYLQANPLLRYQ